MALLTWSVLRGAISQISALHDATLMQSHLESTSLPGEVGVSIPAGSNPVAWFWALPSTHHKTYAAGLRSPGERWCPPRGQNVEISDIRDLVEVDNMKLAVRSDQGLLPAIDSRIFMYMPQLGIWRLTVPAQHLRSSKPGTAFRPSNSTPRPRGNGGA